MSTVSGLRIVATGSARTISTLRQKPPAFRRSQWTCRTMASIPHQQRTATEPRQDGLHDVTLDAIDEINDSIRVLSLAIADRRNGMQLTAVKFLPGQWLDVHLPGLDKAGGFTITSPPSLAKPPQRCSQHDPPQDLSASQRVPCLELAVQKSVKNPAAAWLWQPKTSILGSKLSVRVGGSFVWPPPHIDVSTVVRLVLIAGGVGINPLMSILSHLHSEHTRPQETLLLYSTKVGFGADLSKVLFLPRLRDLLEAEAGRMKLKLFATDLDETRAETDSFRIERRRMNHSDLEAAVGTAESRKSTLCYVCGPAAMTDEFVDVLKGLEGMDAANVMCERWW